MLEDILRWLPVILVTWRLLPGFLLSLAAGFAGMLFLELRFLLKKR